MHETMTEKIRKYPIGVGQNFKAMLVETYLNSSIGLEAYLLLALSYRALIANKWK